MNLPDSCHGRCIDDSLLFYLGDAGRYSDHHSGFKKPVFIRDELNIHGSVIFMSDSVKVVEIKAYITNQEEHMVSSAKIRVGLLE